MRLFLVRHGQTESNVCKTYTGQRNSPLTDMGRQQAENIRPILEQFHFDRVYTSDLSRAIDTQLLALPGVEGIRTPLLREFDTGSITNKTFEQVGEMLGGRKVMELPGQYKVFGGESVEDVSARLRKFLTILENDPCENVVAFSHNGALGVMLETILDVRLDRSKIVSANCAIHVFEFDNRKWKLLAWNYMGKI